MIRVLYLGLMAGDNGFIRPFNKLTNFRQVSCGLPDFNEKAQRVLKEFNPELVFIQIQAPNILSIETLNALKNSSAYVIHWTGDVRNPIPNWYFEAAEYVDITCFSNMNDVDYFNLFDLPSSYLDIGFDPEIYKPLGQKMSSNDIVFMGNNYGNLFPLSQYRIEMVDFLRENYPKQFSVYGSGWHFPTENHSGSQHNEAAVYRGAKIAINLSHFDYDRYNSDRILRIMGTGIPICLTKRYKGIELDFKGGIDLGIWDDFKELKYNIDYYLANEPQRINIAQNGCKLVNENCTFEAMILNILKIYNAR